MLAARLYGKQDLRVEQVPIPHAGPGELLLRVRAAAVCGTDLRMYQNGAKGVDESHPLVPGHEFAGEIEELGEGVTGWQIGQPVSVAPNIGCGTCPQCVAGHQHHCKTMQALGVHQDGGFAEYVRIPAAAVRMGNVTPIPAGLSFEAAAACEALSCVYSAYERYRITPGDCMVIIGAGAIGLMHAMLGLLSGAGLVIMNDLSPQRLEQCTQIESRLVPVADNLEAEVLRLTHNEGADVVITACAAPAAQQAAFGLGALDGRICFFGGLPKNKQVVSLDTNVIHYRQLTVFGTTRASLSQYRHALNLLGRGLLKIDPILTHRFQLDDIGQAFENTAGSVGLKQVIVFD